MFWFTLTAVINLELGGDQSAEASMEAHLGSDILQMLAPKYP